MNKLADVDWDNWQASDPATLVFVIEDGKILLIDKKTGLGKGKINGPGGKVEKGEAPGGLCYPRVPGRIEHYCFRFAVLWPTSFSVC